jgi:hypothetical protein
MLKVSEKNHQIITADWFNKIEVKNYLLMARCVCYFIYLFIASSINYDS